MSEVMEREDQAQQETAPAVQEPEAASAKPSLKEKWKGLPKKKRRRIIRWCVIILILLAAATLLYKLLD